MNNSLQIIPLTLQPGDVDRFLNVVYPIYGDDPNWVAPLLMDVKKVFTKANPLFEHAEMQLWMATKDGRDVGRIAGILDHNHNRSQKDSAAFFGFFETVNDPEVSRALFKVVFDWAREKGLKRVLGPMNPTTNDECGLLVEGFDSPPVLMMTYNPRYYVDLIQAEGFIKSHDLLAYYIDIHKSPLDRLGKIATKVRSRHPELTFRPILRKTLLADLGKVKEIYNSAWETNWGFTPMTDSEMNFMADRLKPLLCEGLVWLAETPTEPVAFLLAIPDYNQAFKPLRGHVLTPKILGFIPYIMQWKYPALCRVITLGVKEKYRNKGLESVLLTEGFKCGFRIGLKGAEASWILEDNVMMCRVMEVFGGNAYKRYRIYEKGV